MSLGAYPHFMDYGVTCHIFTIRMTRNLQLESHRVVFKKPGKRPIWNVKLLFLTLSKIFAVIETRHCLTRILPSLFHQPYFKRWWQESRVTVNLSLPHNNYLVTYSKQTNRSQLCNYYLTIAYCTNNSECLLDVANRVYNMF